MAAVRAQTRALDVPDTLVRAMTAVYANCARAAVAFSAGVFHGDLVHVRAAQEPAAGGLTADAWTPHVTGAVLRHAVPCTHDEMTTQEPLAAIGAVLAAALAQHEEGSP